MTDVVVRVKAVVLIEALDAVVLIEALDTLAAGRAHLLDEEGVP